MYLANPDFLFDTFFFLLFCHCLADFPWQNDFLAKAKDPTNNPAGIWIPCMLAHCVIHAGMVYALTGSTRFTMYMLITHFIIDYAKCTGRLGKGPSAFVKDQIMHLIIIVSIALMYCETFK